MMRPASTRVSGLVEYLRSSRLAIVLAAISGMWLMVWLGVELEPTHRQPQGVERWGVTLTLLITGAIAFSLGSMGIALNDVLDRRHDRTFDPQARDRPVASGVVPAGLAVTLASLAGLIALTGGFLLGPASAAVTLAVVLVIVFYNTVGRFFPAVGVITLGLSFGLGMAIPNPRASFAWPVLLVITHVIFCGAMRLILERRGPRPGPLTVAGIMLGWGFWSLLILLLIRGRGGWDIASSQALTWVGPSILVTLFLIYSGFAIRRNHPANVLNRRYFRYVGFLWLILYNMAWLTMVGLIWPSMLHQLIAIGLLVFWLTGRGITQRQSAFIDELTSR